MNPHLQRAHMLYQRSRYDEAERELGMALTQDPEEAWAYALMGACRAAQKDFAKADELGRQAIGLAPDSGEIRHLVARIQIARNDLPAAERTVTEAIELDPYRADYYAARALVHAQRKAWDKALADCESALTIDPEHIEAINVRSLARRGQGDRRSATAELEHALKLNPEDAYSHANLGWTHLEAARLDEAEKHFREALRIDPELDWARVGVLETLKARVPVYRWILGYFLWMQTKAAGAQWAIIIGLYVVYRVVRSIANNNPALAPFLFPFLLLYLLFVLATWFAKPLADTALLLHPFGRLALTTKEKLQGTFVTCLILTVVGLLLAYNFTDTGDVFLALALFVGFSGLPLAMSFKFEHPKPKRILQVGAVVVALCGIVVLADSFTDIVSNVLPPAIYNSLMPPVQMVFFASALVTLIGTNILASQQWRQ